MIKISQKEKWLFRANAVHCEVYDYSNVNYINNKTTVEIICPEHGVFWQRPDHHMAGVGCYECGRLKTIASRKLTNELVDQKLIDSNRNIKRIGDIIFAKEHTEWTCLEEFCKMSWSASPDSVINSKNGCPHCHYRKNTLLSGSLYLVEFTNKHNQDTFLKIGITKATIKRRFHSHVKNYSIKVLCEIKLSLADAYKIEQQVIFDMKTYQKIPNIKFSGKTECFINSTESLSSILEQIRFYHAGMDGNNIEHTSSSPSSNDSTINGHASKIMGCV